MAFSKVILSIVLFALLLEATTAQSTGGCTRALMGLTPCLSYVNGNTSTPSSSCCLQLASVVQTQPQCLCTLVDGSASSYGINVNQTLAMALPGACKVQTPPVSKCNTGNGSTASPDTPINPTNSSKTPVSTTNTPSGAESKIAPSPSGSGTREQSGFVGFMLLIASSWALYGSSF